MKKTLLILGIAIAGVPSIAQKFVTEKTYVKFFSDAAIEDITAENRKTSSLFDSSTGEIVFSVPIREFQFDKSLMQEHFNEKYMESELFPKARFSGKIIEPIDFGTNKTYDIRAKGVLDIHGQKQTRIIKASVTIEDGDIKIKSRFFVPLSDHNISIPSIVSQKIATEIEVEFTATMSLQSL